MKWVGQQIYDFISRFRNDVYLEASVNPESDVDKFLVQGSDGKIGFRTGAEVLSDIGGSSTAGDITSVVAGVGLSGGATTGDATLTVDFSEFSAVTPRNGDSLASLDSDGSTEQLTTVAALATLFAGDGLTASSSVIAVDTLNQNTTGSAATLTTPRAIFGHNFDGSAALTGVIASANLDADTAHLTTAQTFTGSKTMGTDVKLNFRDANSYIYSPTANDLEIVATDITLDAATVIELEANTNVTGTLTSSGSLRGKQVQAVYTSFQADDIDTKHYLAFNDGDSENTSAAHVDMPIIAPVAGKLLSVSMRISRNLSADTYTLRLETQATGVTFSTGPTIVGTQSGSGPTNTSMVTYDFTSSLDSGDNIIDAGDVVHVSIQSDSSAATTKYYFTCLFEWDYSGV